MVQKEYRGAPSRGPEPESYASHDNRIFSECDSNHISILLIGLYEQNLWPLTAACRRHSLNDALTALDRCDFTASRDSLHECHTCSINAPLQVKNVAKTISTAFAGLCLDCVVNGRKVDGKAKPCRLSHGEFMGLDVAQIFTDKERVKSACEHSRSSEGIMES